MELAFGIISAIALGFCAIVIIDRVLFSKTVQNIKIGMTGMDIKNLSNSKFVITKIENQNYEAVLYSRSTMFKCNLLFINGKLVAKHY